MSLLPFFGLTMDLKKLHQLIDNTEATKRMPTLFLGHGSPMNAIEENEFVRSFRALGKELIKPTAILCISAHWETKGTFVTAMEHPPTIHDFGGFPKALFDVQYPAPGSPTLASEIKDTVKTTTVGLDDKWGLDHGAWSVIKHLYPLADIPVLQLSIDYTKPPEYHYSLASELKSLRDKGVLIIGSGNLVHNLGLVDWRRLNESFAFDWAEEASEKIKSFIINDDHNNLIRFGSQGKAFNLAIPTPEHFMPLLYVLSLKDKNDKISFFNDKPVAGSLTMTSVKLMPEQS